MPTVTVVQQSLRRYRETFYVELRARLADEGVDLRVIESRPEELPEVRGDHLSLDWAEQARGRLFSFRGRELVWQDVRAVAHASDLVIVEQGSRLLVNYVLLAEQQLARCRLAYWGHGRDFHESASGLGEWLKAFTSRRVHWWFAYNSLAVDVVRSLGFPPERITDVRNSTDSLGLRAHVDAVAPIDRQRLSDELGLGPGPIGVAVGAMTAAKRLDYLFAAADHARARITNFQLVLVGAGAELDQVRRAVQLRPWIRVSGPRFGRDLAEVLALADVMLIPAGVGLVAVDAFAAGLPLVASASQKHRPEISYIEHGRSGLLVEDGGDPRRYGDAVVELLGDDARLAELAAGSRAAASSFSAEGMAQRFTEGIMAALRS